jgi:transposase
VDGSVYARFFATDVDRCGERSCVRPDGALCITAGLDEVRVPGSLISLTSFKALTAPRGVLSDGCEPVSDWTVTLSLRTRQVDATLRERRHPVERVVFEAGTMSQHLYFGLKAEGYDVVCMEARQVNAALSAMRNKTDMNDARGIEQVLRTGWFGPVHMKSREAHGVRALLSTRKALLKKTMDLANEVRGLLKIFGIRLPKTVKHGSFDGVVRPLIEMDDVLVHALVPLLDAPVVLYQHFLELDRRVKRAASHDQVFMVMMTVPGVGPIASLTFKAAVDDPTRFKRSRTVGAHFGLTPRRYQSGEHDNSGRISKAGD